MSSIRILVLLKVTSVYFLLIEKYVLGTYYVLSTARCWGHNGGQERHSPCPEFSGGTDLSHIIAQI